MPSHYDILGVDKKATEQQIKKAYRELSLKNHPDRNINDPTAHSRFQEINAAYEILGDTDKRRQYDMGFGDNDMGISVELTNNDIQPRERTLDAIYIYDDDLDETKSIIWVQCRKCKWSCPIETGLVGECNCTCGAEEIKEELQVLDMDGNIMGEDIAEWPEYDDMQMSTQYMMTPLKVRWTRHQRRCRHW